MKSSRDGAAGLTGAELDRLTLAQSLLLAGKWIAMEIYDEETAPARRIAAVGDSAGDCVAQIRAKGLDPLKFEYRLLRNAMHKP